MLVAGGRDFGAGVGGVHLFVYNARNERIFSQRCDDVLRAAPAQLC